MKTSVLLLAAASACGGSSSTAPVDDASTFWDAASTAPDANGTAADVVTSPDTSTDAPAVVDGPVDGDLLAEASDAVVDVARVDASTKDASQDARGSDAAAEGGATTDCIPACPEAEVCVLIQLQGGAVFSPDDAGHCPAGLVPDPSFPDRCMRRPTFVCSPIPSACRANLNCTCAASVCQSQVPAYPCIGTSPGQVDCILQAP